MNELSLFTGAGGGLLGTKLLGFKHIGYVENNDYCQKIIAQRIKDGILDEAPIFIDIRTFISEGFAAIYQGLVDVVTAGFPCQPFSVAGKGLGENDPRNMWPETFECVRIIRPQFVFLENVPGLLAHRYFGRILGDLAESGYGVRWMCLSAADVGANHKRNRLWIMAYAQTAKCESAELPRRGRLGFTNSRCDVPNAIRNGLQGERQGGEVARQAGLCGGAGDNKEQDVFDSENIGYWQGRGQSYVHQTHGRQDGKLLSKPAVSDWWSTEPNVGRVANGVAHRVDRIRAIGNGQVPAVVARAWEILTNGMD